MKEITIDVATQFTPRPFGRYRVDGERSAEQFRDDILIPALRKNDHVIVDLSGSNLYGSSFLEETFGGLIRVGVTKHEALSKLEIIHRNLPSIVKEAWHYIEEAQSAA